MSEFCRVAVANSRAVLADRIRFTPNVVARQYTLTIPLAFDFSRVLSSDDARGEMSYAVQTA